MARIAMDILSSRPPWNYCGHYESIRLLVKFECGVSTVAFCCWLVFP
jgi:hypothetical protein